MTYQHDDGIKYYAHALYLRQHRVAEIASAVGVPARTVYDWIKTGNWVDDLQHGSIEATINQRLLVLVNKEDKTEKQFNEIDRLINNLKQLDRVRQQHVITAKLQSTPAEQVARETAEKNRRKRGPNKNPKNDVSQLKINDFKKLHVRYFDYQKEIYENYKKYRNRMFLKSRQIGFTWYFAQEAFEDATLNGRNKIFLSATRAQADIFRRYIVTLAKENFNIELKGDPIELHTAAGTATLYFLSTNSSSAQSYHGDVYIDEFFWIRGFNQLYKVASGMGAHKQWRKTLFSTPSSVMHEAHDFWSGERFQKRFKNKTVLPEFPDNKKFRRGILCPDNIYRKIFTLDDAEKGGCNLFDRAELQLEYSPDEFKNLFMCKFIDDTHSVFNFAKLEKCMDDAEKWSDIDFESDRPAGSKPVWCGYDPSRHRDNASFVVVLPATTGKKHRIIERFKWLNRSYTWQADQIENICQRYNVQYIGVDVTGPGLGVLDLVRDFFPQVTPIHYNPEIKSRLVLKTKEIIETGRLIYPADWTDIAHAFLTIRQSVTPNGNITYSAGRTSKTGHADIAWAVMHALDHEPISVRGGGRCGTVAIF